MKEKKEFKLFFILPISIIVFILVGAFLLLLMRVDTRKSNAVEIKGIPTYFFEGGIKDANFRLQNDSNKYYINRGLENGLELRKLNSELVNKEIIVWYSKSWRDHIRPVMQLQYKDSIYFTVW